MENFAVCFILKKLCINCLLILFLSNRWLCHNFSINSDELGRNFLHIASVCGKCEIVEWLIKQCKAEIDAKDLESGWTALHRSFYYGQLASARILCMVS